MTQRYLKCDRPGCAHTIFVETITQADVGRPCPKCGFNLLTQSDYNQWVNIDRVLRVNDFIINILRFFGWRPKSAPMSFGREDIRPGETYTSALIRKSKEASRK